MSSAIESAEESGDILALLVILNCHVADMDLCEEGLSSIYRILSSKTALDEREETKTVTDTLVLCLRKHRNEAPVVEVALSCMVECAKKSKDLQTLLCIPDTIELIIRVMCIHVDGEETVQEQGCLLIGALANNSADNVIILRSLHVEKVLDQAAGLITNERNKKYPREAKKALGH